MDCDFCDTNFDNSFGLEATKHEKDLSSNRWTFIGIDTIFFSLSP